MTSAFHATNAGSADAMRVLSSERKDDAPWMIAADIMHPRCRSESTTISGRRPSNSWRTDCGSYPSSTWRTPS